MSHRNFSKKSRNGKHRNPRVESPEFPRTGLSPRFPAHGGHEPSYYGPPNGWTQRDQGHFGFNQEVGQNSPFTTPSDFQRGRNPHFFNSWSETGSRINMLNRQYLFWSLNFRGGSTIMFLRGLLIFNVYLFVYDGRLQ